MTKSEKKRPPNGAVRYKAKLEMMKSLPKPGRQKKPATRGPRS